MSSKTKLKLLWITCLTLSFLMIMGMYRISKASPASGKGLVLHHATGIRHHPKPRGSAKKSKLQRPRTRSHPHLRLRSRSRLLVRLTSRSGASGLYRTLLVRATAYAPCRRCCGKTDGITALGLRARRGIIAVDPRVIPLGSHVFVQGYGPAIAADTGRAITGHHIDVCFPTYHAAKAWGKRLVIIHIALYE